MSIAPPRNVSPGHQRLYNRNETPLNGAHWNARSRSRISSIMLPSETPRSRSAATVSRGRRTGSVVSQRSTGFGMRRTGSSPPQAIGGHTYVADVNPTFCIDGSIRCAEPINDRVAWTAEYDGTVRIRALPQGSELQQLEGRENTYCSALLYVTQFQCMWAAFNDGFIRVYEATTGRMIQEVVQHAGGVNCMVEMEGSVYTGGVDWKIGLWNPETTTFERLFFGHSGAVRSLCTYNGPSGSILFSGSDDGTIRAWDPYAPVQTEEDRACLHVFKGHDRGVLCLEALPHLSQLWSGGEDTTVRVWNLQTLEAVKVLKGHTAPVSTLLPVESRMWSGDKHGRIILWDLNTLTALQEISTRMQGPKLGMVLAMKKIQPSSCWKVWTAGSTGFVQCWNAETVPIVFDAKNQYKYGNRGVHELVQELESYIQALQDELAAAKEDATMNYERGRMEVQRELMAHQLLQEENEQLRNRLRQLDGATARPPPHDLSLLKESQTEMDQSRSVDLSRSPESSPSDPPHAVAAIIPPGNQYKGPIASARHQRHIPGPEWAALIAQRPHQVREMAKEEVCMAVGIPPAQISKWVVEPVSSSANGGSDGTTTPRGISASDRGGLRLACVVTRPAEMPAEEVQRRLDSFAFPRLQQLHRNASSVPRGGLDAAEERIRQLESQLQRGEAQTPPEPRGSNPNNSALEQEVERLKDENDILRGMLDDAAETPSTSDSQKPDSTKPIQSAQLEEELDSAKETIEYLKDVIAEKEQQRTALQAEVQQLRLGGDSETETPATNGEPASVYSPDGDETSLAQMEVLEGLLHEARSQGEAAAQHMKELFQMLTALRRGTPVRARRPTKITLQTPHSGTNQTAAPSHPGDHSRLDFQDVSVSTDDPSMNSAGPLQRRVQRDTLERPPYPRWMDHDAFDNSPSPKTSQILNSPARSRRVDAHRTVPSPLRPPVSYPVTRSSGFSEADLVVEHATLQARVRDAEAVAAALLESKRRGRA